jgi:hypothetical protein
MTIIEFDSYLTLLASVVVMGCSLRIKWNCYFDEESRNVVHCPTEILCLVSGLLAGNAVANIFH